MEHLTIPEGYQSPLTIRETEVAIKEIKDHFERALAKSLHLTRVSAPLFVKPESGLNDNLNGVERPVSFGIKEQNDNQGETIDDSETTIYTYYDNQQLFSAENDTTRWEYTYDERGNILTRQEYNVSINNNGEKVYSFRDYDSWTLDSNWKDKLAKFNGQTITYDAIGNPISYKGNTLTPLHGQWEGSLLLTVQIPINIMNMV